MFKKKITFLLTFAVDKFVGKIMMIALNPFPVMRITDPLNSCTPINHILNIWLRKHLSPAWVSARGLCNHRDGCGLM